MRPYPTNLPWSLRSSLNCRIASKKNLSLNLETAENLFMITIVLLTLFSAPGNTVIRAPIDLILPKTPTHFGSGEVQASFAGTDRTFAFTSTNPGLLSFNLANMTTRDFTISKIPDKVSVGSRSLFYMKDGSSTDFVFTNNARNYIYYGSNASGSPVVNVTACGPFSQISDLHLTETVGGVTNYLIVADKGAARIYSYVLTPGSATQLCTSEQSISVQGAEWIRSLSAVNPTVYIGYRDSTGLRLRNYRAGRSATTRALRRSSARWWS